MDCKEKNVSSTIRYINKPWLSWAKIMLSLTLVNAGYFFEEITQGGGANIPSWNREFFENSGVVKNLNFAIWKKVLKNFVGPSQLNWDR